MISLTECAERLEVTRVAVQKAIQRGDIAAEKVGSFYTIREYDCLSYRPATPQEKGQQGAQSRWANHEKPEQTKPTRGRPRKNAEVKDLDEDTYRQSTEAR